MLLLVIPAALGLYLAAAPAQITHPEKAAAPAERTVFLIGPMPDEDVDRKSTRLNSSHIQKSRMPSSA